MGNKYWSLYFRFIMYCGSEPPQFCSKHKINDMSANEIRLQQT